MKYIPLFILIQFVSAVLTILGLPVVAYYAYIHPLIRLSYSTLGPRKTIFHFGHRWPWIWDNEEDGIDGGGSYNRQWSIGRRIFVWSALRNPCNNLRLVRGVSKVGRPLFYRTWFMFKKQFYFKAGWMSNGYPALSGGAGRGY